MGTTKDNDSWWLRLCAFLSLTDADVLRETGRYDRMLAYAMVFRQLVTFAFTFLLFSYGVSLFLSPVAAYTIGFVFALTLFFLDQAIIGSDWALRNPFKKGIPWRMMLGLIPRLAYSLIIAIGLATLAEISLQANAIDEQIQKDVAQNNQEYFKRMAEYEAELDTTVDATAQKITDTQGQINDIKARQELIKNTEQAFDEQTIAGSLDHYRVTLEELQRDQKNTINAIAEQNARLSQTRQDYQFWFNEAILERTGKDGRAPTEGPKYQRAVKTYTELEGMIPIIEAEIAAQKERLATIEQDILANNEQLNDLQLKSNALSEQATEVTVNEDQLSQLNAALVDFEQQHAVQVTEKQEKMADYRQKLINDGLFYEQKTGLLVRYLALNKIHSDPQLGEVAVLFSAMLKIFFIAIELMPVIIKLFFSPFSFYSLRMYRKMQVALLEEQALLEAAEKHYKENKKPHGDPPLITVEQQI